MSAPNSQTIALLNEVAEYLEGYEDVRDGPDGPLPNAAMSLRQQVDLEIERLSRPAGPAEEVWIAVSDRLPPVNVPVIAHWRFKNTDFYECPDLVACYDGRIWHSPDDTDDDYSAPAYWTPIPEAPKSDATSERS